MSSFGIQAALLSVGLALSASLAYSQAVRPESRVGRQGNASEGNTYRPATPAYPSATAASATAPSTAKPSTPAAAAANAPAQSATAAAPASNSTLSADGRIETLVPTSRVSSGISSAITAGLPKYQPPKPPAAAPSQPQPIRRRDPGEEEIEEPGGEDHASASVAESGESAAADQPRNKIIRLPKYVVEADRPPIFKEREILTKQALAELAVRRYLSRFDSKVLNRFTLPIIGVSPEARAMAMYAEDVRLENMSELRDAAETARRGGDRSASDYILKETNRTFLRSGGMDWTSRRAD